MGDANRNEAQGALQSVADAVIDRQRLKVRLATVEDDRPFVYDDATGKAIKPGYVCVGYPTIGVGRNLYGKGLSESERQFLLDNDITDVLQIAKQFTWFDGLETVRQHVILELLFNMGLEKFKGFRNFINYTIQSRWAQAAAELKNSAWYSQVHSERADPLIEMFKSGEWQ
jgi:lysozyme